MRRCVLALCTVVLLVCAGRVRPAGAQPAAAAKAAQLNEEGLALYEAGAHEEAIDRFTRAYELQPEEPVLIKNLANAHAAYGAALDEARRDAAAIQHFRYALELAPGNESAHAGLTNLYYRRGNYTKAQAELGPYVREHPEDTDARTMLGELYYRTGDLAAAVREWEGVLRRTPRDTDLRERLHKAKRELAVEGHFEQDRNQFFTVRYEGDRMEDAGYHVLRLCSDARRDIGRELQVYPQRPLEVILYTTAQFDAVTQAQSHVAGLYDGKIRIRVPPGRLSTSHLRRVVFHEYAHLAIGELTQDNCPYWLNEGLAQWFSEDFTDAHRHRLRRAALPPTASLEQVDIIQTGADRLLLLNAASFALVDYLRARYSSRYLLDLLRALGNGVPSQEALRASYRRSYAYLDKAVAAYVAE